MFKRPFNTVLARLGLVAAVLATLLILAPAASAADAEYDYPENGTDPVATFSATDPDADADDPEWDLAGPDAELFEISDEGVLTFEDSPNFEDAKDNDEDKASGDQGAGDNVYKVTVTASGGELDVEVTVTNVNEPGSVSFDQLQAQSTRTLVASFKDDDGKDKPTWQWSRGSSASGPWTAIEGATSSDRTPDEDDDAGSWLRATVSYTDSFGAQTAERAIGPVVTETLSNAAPSFSGLDEDDITAEVQVKREVDENEKGTLGEPITATDANGDPRQYTIGGADEDCFSIDGTSGQLSLSAERDFESAATPCKDGGVVRTAGDNTYVVVVTATDPSGAPGIATVTVTVKDVNEAPEFTDDASKDTQKTLYIDENVTVDLALRTGKAVASPIAPPVPYVAEDEDRQVDADGAIIVDTAADGVTYSVEGADEEHFDITDGGVLSIKADEDLLGADGANFEDKSSYSITIVATSTGTNDDDGVETTPVRGKTYATLAVTVKVVDGEDPGKVTFPTVREAQEGKQVLAKLSDPDGGESSVEWQWYRGNIVGGDDTDTDPDQCPDATYETNPTDFEEGWQPIADANSATYTPDSATFDHDEDAILDGEVNDDPTPEVAYCLRATATYTDNIVSEADGEPIEDTASEVTGRPVQEDNPANAGPEFADDQDPSTPGKQAVAERSVKENAEDEKVGDPVVADDKDLLVYAISDTANFEVSNGGQISTKVELDYEALPEDAKYHMVMLTATDPSGASGTIMVKITVTDENDDAEIAGAKSISYDENGTDPVATFSATDPDADADDPEWDLAGPDAELFEISDEGVLTFEDSPNFEDAKDNDEDKASGDQGAGDNVYKVTVTASGGELDVEVTVTNVNEPGSVSFDQLQAQSTRTLVASFKDDDGKDKSTWQWSRGSSASGPWTAIEGATSSDRTPDEDDDVGSWLLATVSYTDSFGAQTAERAIGPVVTETLANAAPSFSGLDANDITAEVQVKREVDENEKGTLGEPITATDANGDPRQYTIGGADEDCFSIDGTSGQLSLSAERDFESAATPCKDGGVVRTAGDNTYVVVVTATDPSGAPGIATVTVTVKDVNEAPEFTDDASKDTQKTLYIDENVTVDLALRTGKAVASPIAPPVPYVAEDEDRQVDADGAIIVDTAADGVTYSVEGADEEHFDITDGGVLSIKADEDLLGADGANFEDKSSYSITIVATSTGTNDDDGVETTPVRGKDVRHAGRDGQGSGRRRPR